MSALMNILFTLILIHTTYSSDLVEINTPTTINWINSGISLPQTLTNAVITYYQNYFIVFGGTTTTTTTTYHQTYLNTKIYIGYTYYTPAPTNYSASSTTPNPVMSPTKYPTINGTTGPTAQPTRAPTASYGFKTITSWTSDHTIKSTTSETFKYGDFNCVSQCYSTNYQGTFLMPFETSCNDDIFLYRFDPSPLVFDNKVHFEEYNLTSFFINNTAAGGCRYSSSMLDVSPSVATNNNNFDQTQTVYIVIGDRIFVYNVSTKTGYFSSNYFTINKGEWFDEWADDGEWLDRQATVFQHRYHMKRSSALIDRTGKYMWITDTSEGDRCSLYECNNDGRLWRYSIEDNIIIDVVDYYWDVGTKEAKVNGTLTKTFKEINCGSCGNIITVPYFFSEYEHNNDRLGARMVHLSNGFILLTTDRRDYIFLPNLTEAVGDWGPPSKTKYIDVACVGRPHEEASGWMQTNTPIYMNEFGVGDSDNILSFGGRIYRTPQYVQKCHVDENEDIECHYQWNYPYNYTDQIRYYTWLNDFQLVVNFTETILFGDNIIFNVYFEPTCDLSRYRQNLRVSTATQHNPIYIEIHITASDTSLDIDRYMYIINASEIIDDPRDYNWDRTYEKCYICQDDLDLYEDVPDWNNEEAILSNDEQCVLCSSGIETGKISEKQAGIQYQINFEMLKSPNNTVIVLESKIRTLTISECAPGYGTTPGASSVDCNECPFNQFTLRESLDPCIACENIDDGLVCIGGNQTELTYNWWVASWDFGKNDLKPFYDIQQYNDTQTNDKIVTALCPPKYCCQDVSGCDYLSEYLKKPTPFTYHEGHGEYVNGTWVWEYGYMHWNDNGRNETWIEYEDTSRYESIPAWNITLQSGHEFKHYRQDDNADIRANGLLCAFGRDVDVPLCGACLEGWSELLGTTQCGHCRDDEGGPPGFVWITWNAFLLTMFLAWYVIFCDSKPIDYSTTITKKQLMIQDDLIGFQTLIFKPCLYYFQSLNPIVDTRGITLWLSPVLAFFNFSFDTVGGQANKICWSEGLDACGEILINLLLPLMLMINLFVPRCCINKKGYGSGPCCCCCKKKKICCCCCACCRPYQEPFFYSAFFRVLLITIGVVLTVCFKYVTYVELEETKLMFYSADKQAFGGWWFLGFFGIIFVLLSFALIYYKIKKQKPDDRFSSNSPYRKFVKSFKEQYWYWEFVLFGRRFFISFFTSVQFVGGDYTNFIFLAVLCIFFGLQIHYKPFAHTRVNKIETLNLMLLILAFTAANFIRLNDKDVFVGWILSICILIPLIIIVIYGLKIVGHRMQWIRYKQDDNKIQVDKMLKRMPKSYRDMNHAKEMGMGATNDELEDNYNNTNSDIKTININNDKNNDEYISDDDEHQDIHVANVSTKNIQKVQMVPINNDSTEFNKKTPSDEGNEIVGYNTISKHKDTLPSTSQHMNDAINQFEMQTQEQQTVINDEDENILENELDVIMKQNTESIVVGNNDNKGNQPPPPMYNPNAQSAKNEGNDVTNM